MSNKFEEIHKETAAYISNNNLNTTVYQRYQGGILVEQWEKKDGEWIDMTKRALLEEELKEANKQLDKYRVALHIKKL